MRVTSKRIPFQAGCRVVMALFKKPLTLGCIMSHIESSETHVWYIVEEVLEAGHVICCGLKECTASFAFATVAVCILRSCCIGCGFDTSRIFKEGENARGPCTLRFQRTLKTRSCQNSGAFHFGGSAQIVVLAPKTPAIIIMAACLPPSSPLVSSLALPNISPERTS